MPFDTDCFDDEDLSFAQTYPGSDPVTEQDMQRWSAYLDDIAGAGIVDARVALAPYLWF